MTTITHTSSALGALATFTYGYNNASELTSYTGPEGTVTFGYDLVVCFTNNAQVFELFW